MHIAPTFQVYRDHGFNMLPILKGEKIPGCSWKEYQMKPCLLPIKYNGAIMLGRIGEIAVIDIDDRETFQQWANTVTGLPEELLSMWQEDTPSGGIHLFTKLNENIMQATNGSASLSKTQGQYGFEYFQRNHIVVVSPSKLSNGNCYGNVRNAFMLKPMPVAIEEVILSAHSRADAKGDVSSDITWDSFSSRQQSLADIVKRTGIIEHLSGESGGRHNYCFFFGKVLMFSLWSKEEILDSGIVELVADGDYEDLYYPEIKTQILRGMDFVNRWIQHHS